MTTDPLFPPIEPHTPDDMVVTLETPCLFKPGVCVAIYVGSDEADLYRVVEILDGGHAVRVVPWVEPESAG